jgi:hypothetical protein
VVSASLEKRQLDYEWVLANNPDEPEEEAPKQKPKRKKKKTEE